jgi:hypothetical protein
MVSTETTTVPYNNKNLKIFMIISKDMDVNEHVRLSNINFKTQIKVILHQFRVKKFSTWKFNLEYGGTFTKLFMHVSSQNMFPTTRNLQIRVHVYRPRHCGGDWLTFGCFVPMIADHDEKISNHGCWGKHTHIPDNDYWGICLFHVVWTIFFGCNYSYVVHLEYIFNLHQGSM